MLPSSSLLTVENLRANYGAARILHGVSFTLAAGEVLVLLGFLQLLDVTRDRRRILEPAVSTP